MSILSCAQTNPSSSSPCDLLGLSVGEIIWAKFSYSRWWPAMIISGSDCGLNDTLPDQRWVFWFGDHTISKVSIKKCVPFESEFFQKYSGNTDISYENAVSESLMVIAHRSGKAFQKEDFKNLLSWAKSVFPATNSNILPIGDKQNLMIPDTIQAVLHSIKTSNNENWEMPENCNDLVNLKHDKKLEGTPRFVEDYKEVDCGVPKLQEATVGDIVWAKLGSERWWPALLIYGKDCGKPSAQDGYYWVYWFGDHAVSKVHRKKLLPFCSEFNSKYKNCGRKFFADAISESLFVLAKRAGLQFSFGDTKQLICWAKSGFPVKDNIFYNASSLALSHDNSRVPEYVQPFLQSIRARFSGIDTSDSDSVNDSDDEIPVPKYKQNNSLDSAAKYVSTGMKKIEEVCIACDTCSKEIVCQHPVFHGGLCKECRVDISETMFSYGNDGKNIYCVICGQLGELVVCDDDKCNRCYCFVCIKLWAGPDSLEKIQCINYWNCFFCGDYDNKLNGFIQRHDDWEERMISFHVPATKLSSLFNESKTKRPIRVLSLFDGIGTGKCVLDQLGIDVEIYYASEIHEDSINITHVRHSGKICHLGNVKEITDSQVSSICPIDLVLGGSPCNDLSLVNPARRGILDPKGSGRLFFEFYRILKSVQSHSTSTHVFFLYENVAAMPVEYSYIISLFLECEPITIDSKFFSAQNRSRYFWGNIPGIRYIERYWSCEQSDNPIQTHYLGQRILLDDFLIKDLGRNALVPKIKTVTTQSNSLRQGKECLMPVRMNGEVDVLWATELEKIFGFPPHYTDIGNLSLGKRQLLLGKGWSVTVVKYLLTPLQYFFSTKMPVFTCN